MENFYWGKDTVGKSERREPSAHAGRVLLLLQTSSHILLQGDIPFCRQGEGLEVGSSLLKGRTECVVRKSGRRCHMAILTIHGLTSKNQVKNVSCPFTCFILTFLTLFFFLILLFFIAATACPSITDEQLGFIQRILEIPLDQRKCWHLINLDTLHLYCEGPDPSPEARKLGEYSRRRK